MSQDLTKGYPLKVLLYFSIPLFIGNLFQQLYTLTDTSIVGKTLGKAALAAVGATGTLHWITFAFFNGLNSGITVLTGQCYGAKDYHMMRRSITTGFIMIFSMTLLVSIPLCIFMPSILRLLNVPDDLLPMALEYSYIIYGFLSIMLLNDLFCNIARALGDSLTPLKIMIVALIINCGLDYFFLAILKWGIASAAWATIIATVFSCAGTIFCIYRNFSILHIEPGEWRFNLPIALKELKIALPIALQFLITASGGVVLTYVLNGQGVTNIAAGSIAAKIDSFAILPIMSFGSALTAYCAQNYGAKQFKRILDGVKATSILLIPFSLIIAVVLHFGAPYFSLLFVERQDTDVIHSIQGFVNCACSMLWVLGLLHIFRHSQQGIGRTFVPMLGGFAEVICRITSSLFLFPKFGMIALYFANPSAWLGATVVLFFGFISTYRFLKQKIAEQQTA